LALRFAAREPCSHRTRDTTADLQISREKRQFSPLEQETFGLFGLALLQVLARTLDAMVRTYTALAYSG
jgi:hypothetical protein